MTKELTVKFATFGPNRGLTLQIGNYQFVDGICEVPEADSSSATRVLCRYHDVCFEHELADQINEYDTKYGSPVNVGDDPVINKANEEVSKRNAANKPVPEKAEVLAKETSYDTESEKEPSVKLEKKKGN